MYGSALLKFEGVVSGGLSLKSDACKMDEEWCMMGIITFL